MSFSGILPGNSPGDDDDFDIFSGEAAPEMSPIPAGRYVVIAERGGPIQAKTGTRGYGIQFRVLEGEFAGRKVWLNCWQTPKAAPISKRELVKFGIDSKQKLQSELPAERFVCEVFVKFSTDQNTGQQKNEVGSIKVIRVETPKADAFAPKAPTATPTAAAPHEREAEGGSELFPFGANSQPDPREAIR